jgi:hypothetical protein
MRLRVAPALVTLPDQLECPRIALSCEPVISRSEGRSLASRPAPRGGSSRSGAVNAFRRSLLDCGHARTGRKDGDSLVDLRGYPVPVYRTDGWHRLLGTGGSYRHHHVGRKLGPDEQTSNEEAALRRSAQAGSSTNTLDRTGRPSFNRTRTRARGWVAYRTTCVEDRWRLRARDEWSRGRPHPRNRKTGRHAGGPYWALQARLSWSPR